MDSGLPSNSTPRRNFLLASLSALAGLILGKKAFAAEETPAPSSLITEGDVLKTHVIKGRPPVEPLDTVMLFERSDNNNERPMTHEVLSLIHEEKGAQSYPWTIYSHLTTSHEVGDACVLCSRLTKNGPGWSSGLHSEVFNHGRAVALGVNVEMTNEYTGTESTLVIGVNVMARGPKPCQHGIHIHESEGGHFEKGICMEGSGQVGVDLSGKYQTGINMHSNNIRLNEGACVELDDAGKVRIRYKQGRIEFLNGDKCIGHIKVDGADHEL